MYYTSKDYQNFALEEYYEREEELNVFSWEDFMVCDSGDMNEEEEERQDMTASHAAEEGGSIHKVETLENLCYSNSSDDDVRSYFRED